MLHGCQTYAGLPEFTAHLLFGVAGRSAIRCLYVGIEFRCVRVCGLSSFAAHQPSKSRTGRRQRTFEHCAYSVRELPSFAQHHRTLDGCGHVSDREPSRLVCVCVFVVAGPPEFTAHLTFRVSDRSATRVLACARVLVPVVAGLPIFTAHLPSELTWQVSDRGTFGHCARALVFEVAGCPHLQHIDLQNCGQVSDRGPSDIELRCVFVVAGRPRIRNTSTFRVRGVRALATRAHRALSTGCFGLAAHQPWRL